MGETIIKINEEDDAACVFTETQWIKEYLAHLKSEFPDKVKDLSWTAGDSCKGLFLIPKKWLCIAYESDKAGLGNSVSVYS